MSRPLCAICEEGPGTAESADCGMVCASCYEYGTGDPDPGTCSECGSLLVTEHDRPRCIAACHLEAHR